MNLRFFLLGLLARRPMSGYDVKQCLESFNWLVCSPSFGSLYPILHTLLEDGLVTVDVVGGEGRPPRKVYGVTEAGKQALQDWISQPENTDASLRAFLMRLMLIGHLSPADLLTHLEQRRSQVAERQQVLEQTIAVADGGAASPEHLALDYGLVLADAEIAWLDRKLAQFSQPAEDSAEQLERGSELRQKVLMHPQ